MNCGTADFPFFELNRLITFCVNFRDLGMRDSINKHKQDILQKLPQFGKILKRNSKSPEHGTIALVLLS